MNKLKINRSHFVELINIEKFVIKKNDEVWCYRKRGYPRIYKCLEGLYMLKKRLVNLNYTIHDFKVERED